MIRSVPSAVNGFTFRGSRMGDAGVALAFNPITAGIGAATSLASIAISSWINSIQLSHQADTATTLIVNGLAQQLQNLVNAYMSEPATCANQRAALDAYDNAWAWLQSPQACGNPSYGSAGNRCISDRAPGGTYPWQTYYRDPIANDARLSGAGCDTGQEVLLPGVTTGSYANTGITSTGGSSSTGQTAAEIAAAAVAASGANGSNISSQVLPAAAPNYLLIGGGILAAVLLAKAL